MDRFPTTEADGQFDLGPALDELSHFAEFGIQVVYTGTLLPEARCFSDPFWTLALSWSKGSAAFRSPSAE